MKRRKLENGMIKKKRIRDEKKRQSAVVKRVWFVSFSLSLSFSGGVLEGGRRRQLYLFGFYEQDGE